MHLTSPLYKNDGKSIWRLTPTQQVALNRVREKFADGTYSIVKQDCLCGGDTNKDIIISSKDRFGLPTEIVLCGHCGLLRNSDILTQKSIERFYKDDYHELVFGALTPTDEYFEVQHRRGYRFYRTASKYLKSCSGLNVWEIGAASGGVLYPFQKRGAICTGIEYNNNYRHYGICRGINMLDADVSPKISEKSADIVILSHVLEHCSNPLDILINARKILADDGLLILEVLGLYRATTDYPSLLHYFMFAHFFYYSKCYIETLCRSAGFDILESDETVTCICKKGIFAPTVWNEVDNKDKILHFLCSNATINTDKNTLIPTKHQIKQLIKKIPLLKYAYKTTKKLCKELKSLILQSTKEKLTESDCKIKKIKLHSFDYTENDICEIKERLKYYTAPNVTLISDSTNTNQGAENIPVLTFGEKYHGPGASFDINWDLNCSDGWAWCELTNYAYRHTANLSWAKAKFNSAVKSFSPFSKAYVFGTGPSLDLARDRDWSDGYRIVCNTIVKDVSLWNYIKPHFIIAADAIYHFGNDKFARAFRKDLKQRLEETDTYFIYPALFDAIVRLRGEFPSEKLIPVPIISQGNIHYNLQKNFFFPLAGNVLPMQLTVACTLAKDIKLWGYDGRAPADQLFWTNSPRQHYTELVPDLQKHHPMFYRKNVPLGHEKQYITKNFGDSLESFLNTAERKGWSFEMLHRSWTETLEKRRICGANYE